MLLLVKTNLGMYLIRGILWNNHMKHLFFILLFLSFNDFAHAGGLDGRATLAQQIIQIGLETPMKFATMSTAVSTGQDMLKNVILDPIANALISSALEGASDDILSWVSGGFGGAEPLLVTNPEEYLKRQGLQSVKGILGNIPSDTIFGDSIFNSLLTQFKGGGDLENTITQLSKSNVPALIQSNLCKDQKLSSLALGAVQNEDGTYDQQELAAKKTELWNYACAGSADDAVVAARLEDLNKQNPSIGGMDALLAITSGDNDYTRSALVTSKVESKIEEQKQINLKELYDGLGPISEKECIDPIPAENGEPAGCNEYVTVTPGDQVGDTLSKALNSGVERLTNIMGQGSLTGMLQGFAISAITSGIKKSLNSSSGGTAYNLPITLPSSRPVQQDLTNDPLKKTENLEPMDRQIDFYSTSINKLASLDSRYLSEIILYENRVKLLLDCSTGGNLYQNRMGRITPVKNSITAEQVKIEEALALISETRAKLNASNSSNEQRSIFTAFMALVDKGRLPSLQAEGAREVEYTQNRFSADQDTELSQNISACEQERAQRNQSNPLPTTNNESPGNN
jgi:hypothetical protein